MPKLTIDGIAVDVPEGTSVMDAAKRAGIEIPALCHVDGVKPLTACMLCVVEDAGTSRTLLSCAAKAADGMTIATDSEIVQQARREVLRMLLSEHVGDCEAPCGRICPASLEIPQMMRRVAAGDLDEALRLARQALILPATLGYVCSAPCERGCHRGVLDEALMIRDTHRQLAQAAIERGDEGSPQRVPASGKRVAIVGGGAAGLAAAWVLSERGHACRVFDKAERLGASLRDLPEDELPRAIFDAEVARIARMGVEFELGRVFDDNGIATLAEDYDAVLLACDDLDEEPDNVFEAIESPMTVNAVGDGKRTANEIDSFLRERPQEHPPRPFDCRLGAIDEHEKAAFAIHRAEPESQGQGRQMTSIEDEAKRCLHCDCGKLVSCRLRAYATRYGVKQHAYDGLARPPIEPIQEGGKVLYEPGKCVRCGLCVEITRRNGETPGLAFAGRGYGMRVRVPFGLPLDVALGESAAECVAACPTGALSWRDAEERSG